MFDVGVSVFYGSNWFYRANDNGREGEGNGRGGGREGGGKRERKRERGRERMRERKREKKRGRGRERERRNSENMSKSPASPFHIFTSFSRKKAIEMDENNFTFGCNTK